MDSRKFHDLAINAVLQVNKNVEVSEMFVVWMCKTLQNNKALIGVHHSPNYYEVTYNGDKNELYVDEYKGDKTETIRLKTDDIAHYEKNAPQS